MDRTTIFNLALRRVGEQTVMSLEETSKNAEIGRLIFEPVYREVLRSHNWNFATFRTRLAETVESPAFGWSYSFQLPQSPECMRIIRMSNPNSKFVIENDLLLTDEENAEIVYIGYVDDMNKLDPLCIKVLYLSLAVEMAYTLVENNTILNGLVQLLEQAKDEARFLDSSEGTVPYIDQSDWLDARDAGSLVNYNKTTAR